MLYFYVTLRAYDSLYGVKLKVAIFICDIPAMLAFLLFQINAFGTVNRSFFHDFFTDVTK